MYLAWLLLEPTPSLHNKYKIDTAYTQQFNVCSAQPAIFLVPVSHKTVLILNDSESMQEAGSLTLQTQTPKTLMLLTTPLAKPFGHKRDCIFFST